MPRASQLSIEKPSEKAYQAAADALTRGELVILPTETVYGVFGERSLPSAIQGLHRLFGEETTRVSGWHAPSAEIAIQRAKVDHPVHQRLLERLLPGPVAISFESGDSVRVPDNAACLAVLQKAHDQGATDIVGVAFSGASMGDGSAVTEALTDDDLLERLEEAGVRVVIDAGETGLRRPSTVVQLREGGAYEITREGPASERYIRDRMRRRILFVCTGNTCRSPMASVIAKRVLRDSGEPEGLFEVASAGIMAGDGMPMTPEAGDALRELGDDPGSHASRQVSASDMQRADVIYGLTSGHVAALKRAYPGSAWKIQLLDPEGSDVPDPIGSPAAVYNETAGVLERLIRARLLEHEPGHTPKDKDTGA